MRRNLRIAGWLIAGALLCSPAIALATAAPKLKVTENRRYLQYENGKPFFYFGNRAWELFHRLNREEATPYLTNRAQKGFTVIQAVVLAQLGGLTVPNLRRLFESLPFTKLVPDQRLILNGPTTGGAKIRAARASDGSFALIYTPRGESFTLDKSVIKPNDKDRNDEDHQPKSPARVLGSPS